MVKEAILLEDRHLIGGARYVHSFVDLLPNKTAKQIRDNAALLCQDGRLRIAEAVILAEDLLDSESSILCRYIIPGFSHLLINDPTSDRKLQELDTQLRMTVKRFYHLPVHTTNQLFPLCIVLQSRISNPWRNSAKICVRNGLTQLKDRHTNCYWFLTRSLG